MTEDIRRELYNSHSRGETAGNTNGGVHAMHADSMMS